MLFKKMTESDILHQFLILVTPTKMSNVTHEFSKMTLDLMHN